MDAADANRSNHARWNRVVLCVLLLLSCVSCKRAWYTSRADRDSYRLIMSRQSDARWAIPPRAVEPPRGSRMQIPANLNCAPKPPDDPQARPLMYCPDGHDNSRYWSKIPTAFSIESKDWIDYLPRDEHGVVLVNQRVAMDLALLHSRDYQTQFELVYLNALGLTSNEFDFALQWFGGPGTQFTSTGDDLGGNRLLQTNHRLGFGRRLAGGGQIATSILNSFFWDFGTNSVQGSGGQIVTTFTQPLLRGAFRHVRLETLTQAERDLLYQVRDFARFRRRFYFDITSEYLSLLTQVQSIRNAQANLESLRQNLIEHQVMLSLKMVAQIQVDQVFQDYQSGRAALLNAEQQLATSLDQFRFQLGLPAWVEVKIDESLLQPFELLDPRLQALQNRTQVLYQDLMQYLPPNAAPRSVWEAFFDRYCQLQDDVKVILPELQTELERWRSRILASNLELLDEDDRIELTQQKLLLERLQREREEIEKEVASGDDSQTKLRTTISETLEFTITPELPTDDSNLNLTLSADSPNLRAWNEMRIALGRKLRETVANMAILQTQVRLHLIDLEPVRVEERSAVLFAQQNRLDQMNRQAQVMDAFRKIEVAADLLESELGVTGQIGLGTDPNKNNAFRFDSSANTYRVGVQFDGPLNRLNERNIYRATQVAYQQAVRSYSAGRDAIANEVRLILRQLRLRKLNFEIARQQLVAATRQVDEAQINLRTASQSSTNLTRDLLQALQGQLSARNNLIANWIDYNISKTQLFVALELLYLDENGVWYNDDIPMDQLESMILSDDYYPDLRFGIAGLFPSVEGTQTNRASPEEVLPAAEPEPSSILPATPFEP